MSAVKLVYDRDQHGTATIEPQHKSVAIGCTHHGNAIDDFSAGDLVAIGLAGCMLFSMGVLARRDGLDLSGTEVDVDFKIANEPFPHIGKFELAFNIPRSFPITDRQKLEKAAGMCPIKASFGQETEISTVFRFAEDTHAAA